jgi:hypothetical protein
MSAENLRKALALADAIDWREGRLAYFRYRRLMKNLALNYGVTLEQATAGFVSLSPNNDYLGNLRSLVTVLKGIKENAYLPRVPVSTYNACKNRAVKFITGKVDFVSHYSKRRTGKKILSFYRNIINPLDPEPVTIDGHAYSIWIGQRMTMKAAVRQVYSYDEVADGYRTVAAENGILPNQLQGVLWFTWKRIHNVIFNPQLKLLTRSDQWGLLLRPEHIKPFPFREIYQPSLVLLPETGRQLELFN